MHVVQKTELTQIVNFDCDLVKVILTFIRNLLQRLLHVLDQLAKKQN